MSAPVATQPASAPTDEQALLGALAVVLLSGAPPAVAISHALPILASLGVAPAQATATLALILPHASTAVPAASPDVPLGPAQAYNQGTALTRLVEYVVAASRRTGQPGHSPARERAHLSAHLRAQQARAEAAQAVDRAARVHGPELGWHSTLDVVTTPECRAAHGSNFQAGQPPKIGYPGTLHGGTCRCRPGAPFHEGLPTDEAVTEGLKRITGSHDVAFSRDGDEIVIDLAFDPAEPRDGGGRWTRLKAWLPGAGRSKLGGGGDPREHPGPPGRPRADDAPARIAAFPRLADAIEAQRLGAELTGQEPQPLERRPALESALARPRNHVAYGGDLADAAAALTHGVSQSQAFRDGNKRTALALTYHFLSENGHRLTAAQVAELGRHIEGYGEGAHTLEDTARWLRSVLS